MSETSVPIPSVWTTRPVVASSRETLRSSRFATHTESPATTRATGPRPTVAVERTSPLAASTATTRLEAAAAVSPEAPPSWMASGVTTAAASAAAAAASTSPRRLRRGAGSETSLRRETLAVADSGSGSPVPDRATPGPVSSPNSSFRSCRARRYVSSASAWRPPRYSASISEAVSRSRSGCSAASASSSPTRSGPRPAASLSFHSGFERLETHLFQARDRGLRERLIAKLVEGLLRARGAAPPAAARRRRRPAPRRPGPEELGDRAPRPPHEARTRGPASSPFARCRAGVEARERTSATCSAPRKAAGRPELVHQATRWALPRWHGAAGIASTARCRPRPSATAPSPPATSSGPRTRNCTAATTVHPGQARGSARRAAPATVRGHLHAKGAS